MMARKEERSVFSETREGGPCYVRAERLTNFFLKRCVQEDLQTAGVVEQPGRSASRMWKARRGFCSLPVVR